jgi:hypothetical protein
MSVDAEDILIERGLTWNHSLSSYPECGLVSLPASEFRAEGKVVSHVPVDDNEAHCIVEGRTKNGPAGRLMKKATVLKVVAGVEI